MAAARLSGASSAQRELVARFRASGGSIRQPKDERRAEGADVYKKGWEVRFNVASKSDALAVQKVLARAGLRGGRPYQKTPNRWIQPLYGRDSVNRFLRWLNASR